jgi:hypothetical protein
MPTLDEAIAREFSRARLQKRRWQSVLDQLGADHRPDRDNLTTLAKAYGAVSEIEYRQSKRLLFDVLDLMTSAILPSEEGAKMGQGERAKMQSRINYHDRLAKAALKDGDTPHADTHRHISAMLRGYLNNRPPSDEMPEPVAKRPIKRSYLYK